MSGTSHPVEAATNGQMRSGEVEVRPGEFLALAGGRPLNLTARELELLTALVEREGRIVSREELYRRVWGEPYRKSDRSVDVYVGKLRQKLDEARARPALHPHPFRLRLPLPGPAGREPSHPPVVKRPLRALYIPFTSRRQVRNRLASTP